LVCEEIDFILNPGGDGKPVECLKDGCYMFIFTHSHQDPSSTVLYVLEFLQSLVRDPIEKCVAIVQPGGDKGMDKFCGVGKSESGAQFGNIPEVEKG